MDIAGSPGRGEAPLEAVLLREQGASRYAPDLYAEVKPLVREDGTARLSVQLAQRIDDFLEQEEKHRIAESIARAAQYERTAGLVKSESNDRTMIATMSPVRSVADVSGRSKASL